MKHLTCFICLLLLCCSTATAQWCATEQIFMQQAQSNPALLHLRDEHDKQTAENIDAFRAAGSRSADATLTIPVVFYVIHDGTPASNVSMQRIESQIRQLNDDFAPHGIHFCYAKKNVTTDSLFIATTGDSLGVFRINSQYTNVNSGTTDAQLKALSNLSPNNYLRIFVVNTIVPAGTGGYAYYPGTAGNLDGIVVRGDVFGSSNYCNTCTFLTNYDKGSTTTHEVGHYLGLYHTFQGGCAGDSTQPYCQVTGDKVCDTPPSPGTFGCPTPPPYSCGGNTAILTNNYMEYTHDNCKNAFTPGQSTRMQFHASAYRPTLINIQNLINTGLQCISLVGLHATISGPTFNGCRGRVMKFNSLNEPGYSYRWYFGDGDSATGTTVTHAYSAEGRYVLQLVAENSQAQVSESQTITVFITPCPATINCSYNIWRGNHTSLNFSSGEPVAVCESPIILPAGAPSFYFNHSFRCDTAGNPLFGVLFGNTAVNGYLFNAQNQYNLADTLGMYRQMVMFPVPGNTNRFCFVNSKIRQNSRDYLDFEYNIIEARNGTVGYVGNYRNVRIPTPTDSIRFNGYLAAIPACSPDVFWLLMWVSFANEIWVYRFDTTYNFTLNQRYPIPAFPQGAIARLMPAPNGREVMINGISGNLLRMPFNPATGQILAHTLYSSTGLSDWAVICYSPNSRFLYSSSSIIPTGSSVGSFTIEQLDLQSADPIVTRKAIATTMGFAPCPKIGPDKKMYFAHGFPTTNIIGAFNLGVINYPNQLEAGNNEVGYNRMGPNVVPDNCNLTSLRASTPQTLNDLYSAFDCGWQPGVPRMFSTARNSCLQYTFTADDCFTASWNFGDPASGAGNTSILTSSSHTFSQPGHYLVTLTSQGHVFTDSVFIDVPSTALAASPVQTCPTVLGSYSVVAVEPQVTYQWSIANGLPATISNSSYADINWQSSPGQIQLIAYNQITGCADTIKRTVTYSLDTNLTAVLTVQNAGSTCAGMIINLQTINTPSVIWYRNGVQVATDSLTYTATQSGQYSVVVSNGCMDRYSNQVQVFVGAPEVTGPAIALCAQQTFTYTTAAFGGATYYWQATGGNIAGGQSTNTVQVQWATTGQHQLIVQQTNPGGASCSDTLSIEAVLCTGLDDALTNKWAIYPNPANSVLNVEYRGTTPTGAELKMVNMLGQVALQQTFMPQGGQLKQQLSLEGLAPGVYTLYIQHGAARVQQRVLKGR